MIRSRHQYAANYEIGVREIVVMGVERSRSRRRSDSLTQIFKQPTSGGP